MEQDTIIKGVVKISEYLKEPSKYQSRGYLLVGDQSEINDDIIGQDFMTIFANNFDNCKSNKVLLSSEIIQNNKTISFRDLLIPQITISEVKIDFVQFENIISTKVELYLAIIDSVQFKNSKIGNIAIGGHHHSSDENILSIASLKFENINTSSITTHSDCIIGKIQCENIFLDTSLRLNKNNSSGIGFSGKEISFIGINNVNNLRINLATEHSQKIEIAQSRLYNKIEDGLDKMKIVGGLSIYTYKCGEINISKCHIGYLNHDFLDDEFNDGTISNIIMNECRIYEAHFKTNRVIKDMQTNDVKIYDYNDEEDGVDTYKEYFKIDDDVYYNFFPEHKRS